MHQRPQPDFALVYAERVKRLVRDVGEDEARARAFEHVVAAYDGARPSAGVAMSHSASQTAMGAFRAQPTSAEAVQRASLKPLGRERPTPASHRPSTNSLPAAAWRAQGSAPNGPVSSPTTSTAQEGARPTPPTSDARRLIVGDVAALTTADLPGVADLAWASPPCQDLSLAGDRAGLDGARSSAFWPFWKLMQGLRAEGRAPRLIVIENVCGLLTSHGGKDFDAICDALADAGYRFGAVVIDAALFVPQSRERVFIIAVDADAHIPAELVADGPMAPRHRPGSRKYLRCRQHSRAPFAGDSRYRLRHVGRRSFNSPTSSRPNANSCASTARPRQF